MITSQELPVLYMLLGKPTAEPEIKGLGCQNCEIKSRVSRELELLIILPVKSKKVLFPHNESV